MQHAARSERWSHESRFTDNAIIYASKPITAASRLVAPRHKAEIGLKSSVANATATDEIVTSHQVDPEVCSRN